MTTVPRPMIWLVAILVALVLPGAAKAAEPKRVLLLHSFGPDFAPWNAYSKIIREELALPSTKSGTFFMVLRTYLPGPEIVAQKWAPPGVVKVN